MKILHISDVHNDLGLLERAVQHAEKGEFDALVCSGDMAGQVFNYNQARTCRVAYDFLRGRSNPNVPVENIVEEVLGINEENLLKDVEAGEKETVRNNIQQMKAAAKDFKRVVGEFDCASKEQYEGQLTILDELKRPAIVVPGNWDSRSFNEAFRKYSVHKRGEHINNVLFAGYGDSQEVPCISNSDRESFALLPPERFVGYSEDELYKILTEIDPDVAVTHNHPRKRIVNGEYSQDQGSFALLAYLRGEQPKLLLCGHSHLPSLEQDEASGTIVVNPGLLGEYGSMPSGHFAEIYTTEKSNGSGGAIFNPLEVKLKRFTRGSSQDIGALKVDYKGND